MSYRLVFTNQYLQRVGRFYKRAHPELRLWYLRLLQLLEANPHHPSLRIRALKGNLEGLFSVSIFLSNPITLKMLIVDEKVILVNVSGGDGVADQKSALKGAFLENEQA